MKVTVAQDGMDGKGVPLTLNGATSVRLKAKEVQIVRKSVVKITGLTSGAVSYIELIVNPGTKSLNYTPPSITTTSVLPIASFTHQMGSTTGNF
jgi:hypothetical protein|tara:strand:- start:4961 stop:5242 length:282 start_codon:yes stop_codon:yes gene_type:complete